jgi:antitoxin component of MazEF toxin-antitoxin module
MIKNTKRVIGIANSVGVIIDRSIAKNFKIKKGDLVEISFRKLKIKN